MASRCAAVTSGGVPLSPGALTGKDHCFWHDPDQARGGAGGRFGPELARTLAVALRRGVRDSWRELRAVEEQVESISQEFGGEDPLKSDGRGLLDDALQRCRTLVQGIGFFVEPFQLPEAGEADIDLVRRLIARAAWA